MDTGGGSVQDCSISANRLNGILVRDGADPLVSGNEVRHNGSSGISLQVNKLKVVWLQALLECSKSVRCSDVYRAHGGAAGLCRELQG